MQEKKFSFYTKKVFLIVLKSVAVLLALLLALKLLMLFLQNVWSHRDGYYEPENRIDLAETLHKEVLSEEDYNTIFCQTGLSQFAVELYRYGGETGIDKILEIQDAFFAGHEHQCREIVSGHFTCEDNLVDEKGQPAVSVPIATIGPGDIFVSFSTHSAGWRHGHAGLVVDIDYRSVLEAIQIGVDSYITDIRHWRHYSNFMILRVKDATLEERVEVVQYARANLRHVPYSLLSGVFGPKAADPEKGVQCAYLPWRAWESIGIDLDGDGGKIVTVRDLVESPEVEILQVYGIDPSLLVDRQCRN